MISFLHLQGTGGLRAGPAATSSLAVHPGII
jgi:hypothetical protein